MLVLGDFPISVFIDNVATQPTIVKKKCIDDNYYTENNGVGVVVIYKFCDLAKKRIRVEVASNNKYIQATFACPPKHVCIVNALNSNMPCVFDGFIDETDETKTVPFCVTPLNEIRNDAIGLLKVREMAKAMERAAILRMYINEAIVCENVSRKWYKRVWFPNYITTNNISALLASNTSTITKGDECNGCKTTVHDTKLKASLTKFNISCTTNFLSSNRNGGEVMSNKSVWAPVDNATGQLYLIVNFIFVYG
ncbi:hypothetical protein [Ectropis obliqua nucleopolyhedrovirus]|uniref:Uncharacterized protein n=1 Tax=Ectropis obliqua nucleopolyhedrovirus TaxID=59376 RepID=Q77SB2_9ABAC|nr:hypothetical protein EONV_gp120 [Ectropis obliqua nucleopolyhedrovirus]AAQ88180.1 hypothetical protein [Ectropis obliqua nucleopolyhedrovirus]AGS47862.1 hypothetical protein wdlz-06GM4 [Ectropis obliqua nucleopolyhedrovirus]QWV59708.1 hypothetical protein EONV_gp120 [Ectropis obliqua nucleopolyhedrovirus]UYO72916.1 hypothetical protein EONV-gp120 [Ectropis obliqua nucleopolyhedrovirus]